MAESEKITRQGNLEEKHKDGGQSGSHHRGKEVAFTDRSTNKL